MEISYLALLPHFHYTTNLLAC
jgi:2Fe-2S ferredoxin